ncbi:hypothetical protein, partial [Duganella callida]|uniref:hypothetical protein n=1 Tax=Duganella callida TaxID=2561932 RepID=UPI00197ADC03
FLLQHQTPTFIDCMFLKIYFVAENRCVRQRRDEIMLHGIHSVNPSFSTATIAVFDFDRKRQ